MTEERHEMTLQERVEMFHLPPLVVSEWEYRRLFSRGFKLAMFMTWLIFTVAYSLINLGLHGVEVALSVLNGVLGITLGMALAYVTIDSRIGVYDEEHPRRYDMVLMEIEEVAARLIERWEELDRPTRLPKDEIFKIIDHHPRVVGNCASIVLFDTIKAYETGIRPLV